MEDAVCGGRSPGGVWTGFGRMIVSTHLSIFWRVDSSISTDGNSISTVDDSTSTDGSSISTNDSSISISRMQASCIFRRGARPRACTDGRHRGHGCWLVQVFLAVRGLPSVVLGCLRAEALKVTLILLLCRCISHSERHGSVVVHKTKRRHGCAHQN